MNRFIAIVTDEHVLSWRRIFLAMNTNVFHDEDEHFSTGNEHVENACLNFSHVHSDTGSYHRPVASSF